MKIFSAAQIKEWDNYTIANETVSSIALMERAARACYNWLIINNSDKNTFKIFCGTGNNGGDGLAIARMLIESGQEVNVYILESSKPGTDDFQNNLALLRTLTNNINFIHSEENFPKINSHEIVIDALFGTGLNKPPEKLFSSLIATINHSTATIVSIDIPSGLYADKSSHTNEIIKAGYTLTFQQYKLAFMMAENEAYIGKIIVLNIELHKSFYNQEDSRYELTDIDLIKAIYKPRKPFSHKGNFGHACLLAGSYGMIGAAVLAARACLKSGVGKLTIISAKKGYDILQIAAPEAMCKISGNNFIKDFTLPKIYSAAGIGPGIGIHASHTELLNNLFATFKNTIVIDADALNTIAKNQHLLSVLPQDCILTPHPKEFDKLFGKSDNSFERMKLALKKSEEYKVYIVLKGHHTLITTPFKKAYFNSTGNAGMAKGGSGDVLTGIITGLVAQGYPSLEACLLGVYLHGMAGDIAAEKFSQEAMTAGNIIDCLGKGFKMLA